MTSDSREHCFLVLMQCSLGAGSLSQISWPLPLFYLGSSVCYFSNLHYSDSISGIFSCLGMEFRLVRSAPVPSELITNSKHASAHGTCKALLSFSYCSQTGLLMSSVSDLDTLCQLPCCFFLLSLVDGTQLSQLLVVCPYHHLCIGVWGYFTGVCKILILLLCLLFESGNSGVLKNATDVAIFLLFLYVLFFKLINVKMLLKCLGSYFA